jgi:hypothetical protein
MDPNALSALDPKLRETYERVMGTSTPQPAATQPAHPPTTQNTTPASPTPSPVMQTPFAPDQTPAAVTISQPLPNSAPIESLKIPHGHSVLINILYILGALVFFGIYVFFWAKIFNFKLPFLG